MATVKKKIPLRTLLHLRGSVTPPWRDMIEYLLELASHMSWNEDDFTMNIETGLGPVLQVGQEMYVLVFNGTGSQLDNGTIVYPVGQSAGRPSVDKSRADTHEKIERPIYVTTMDIPAVGGDNDGYGIATNFGYVRELDTSALDLGTEVYISTTVDGALQSTKPQFPDYPVRVGGVTKTGVTDGEIFVAIGGSVSDTFNNFWNGTFRETIDFTVASNGTIVTGSLVPDDSHPDMTMIFSDGFEMLTTTPPATIVLTPGTDAFPQTNYVHIPKSTKVLTVSTSDWPTSEHIKVATVVLRTAATTLTDEALGNRNWNDHIEDTISFQGHLSHITERIRQEFAKWDSGVQPTITIIGASSPDDVYISTTSGFVYQLHKQAFPALDMQTGDDIHIVNDSVNPYDTVTNLNTVTSDSTGSSLTGRHFSFVVWGIQNRTGETSHLMLNLPGGSYTSSANAIADADSFSNYSIPTQFSGTGFLIARFTLYLSAAGGGTWTLNDTQDLRGSVPNNTAGGGGAGGGGVTSFTGLTDTPSSYLGQALKRIRVNSAESALEFTDDNDLVIGQTIGGGTGTVGNVYYLTTTADTWLVSDQTTESTISGQLGICSAANHISFSGLLTLTAHGLGSNGVPLYVGTSGAITATESTTEDYFSRIVAYIEDVDTIRIAIDDEWYTIGLDFTELSTKTSDYTITSSDITILADASSNTVDISMPPSPSHGQEHRVKCIDATFTCRILRNGKNIDGAASDLTLALNVAYTLQYDSSYGWCILC